MLQSGAEIHRVEDTIHRILKVSGMKTAEAFVMPTGLIVTLDDPRMDSMTVVKRIKTRGTNLSRIAEVNDISRRFCSGNISLEEAFHSLKHMKQYTYTALQKYIAQIMVAFFFAILLGGNGWDAVGAGAAGIGMVLILYLGRKIGLNDFFQLLLASAVIAVVAYLAAENPYQTIQMDIVKMEAITQETRLLCRNHIDTAEQLCSYKGSLETEMSALLQKRKELYSKSRRTSGEEKEAVKAELSDISGRLKVIRKEVRLCEGISARSDTLKEKLQTIRADEHEQQRKELMKNEHRRRSGRTNRPNELGGL